MQSVNVGTIEKLQHLYDNVVRERMLHNIHPVREASRQPFSYGILHGGTGICLFALELYKQTQERHIMADISCYTKDLDRALSGTRTNNHSLLNGLSGISYLYLELFRLTKEQSWLDKCLVIIRDYWMGTRSQLRLFDNTGLPDGVSGMLLFYLQLFDVNKEDWLLDIIRQCTLSLVGKASLGETGIYWTKGLYEAEYPGNWPSGNAAVALCLFELGRYFDNGSLSELVPAIFHHKNYSSGSPGSYLVRLYADAAAIGPNGTGGLSSPIHPDRILPTISTIVPSGLYDGLAGWVLIYKEAFSITNDGAYGDAAVAISQALTDRLPDAASRAINLSFYNGISGIAYALLKTRDPGSTPSLLLPGISNLIHASAHPIPIVKPALAIDKPTIVRLLIQENFKISYPLLKSRFRNELDEFLPDLSAACYPIHPLSYATWVQRLEKDLFFDSATESISEIVDSELTGSCLREETLSIPEDDDIFFAQRASGIFALTDECLMSLKLSVSDKFYIFKREKILDLSEPLDEPLLDELLGTYGSKSYFMRVSKYGKVEKGKLNLWRLYLDLFDQAATVEQAVARVLFFAASQDDRMSEALLKKFVVRDAQHLYDLLRNIALGSIRWLYAAGVLEQYQNDNNQP